MLIRWTAHWIERGGRTLFRGLSLDAFVAQIFGNDADVTKGRQMPCHPSDRATRYVNMSSCVGSQIPHAVGAASGSNEESKMSEPFRLGILNW